MRSKKGSLHKSPRSPYWQFRRYSSIKQREFQCSTGIEATDKNRSRAYAKGIELFDEWLGTHLRTGRHVLIRDIAMTVLRSKETKKHGKRGAQYRSANYQIGTKIIPSFGHMKPAHLTSGVWDEYDAEERAPRVDESTGKVIPGRTTLRNTRTFLNEILKKAKEAGLIKSVPEFSKNDPQPSPPKYLSRQEVRKILKAVSAPIIKKRKKIYSSERSFTQMKYLFFLMWKQGARPEEVLQYQWSMFHWKEGKYGTLHIPGVITKTNRPRTIPVNSRVSRVFRALQKKAVSKWVFPSPYIKGERQKNYSKAWESARARAGIQAVAYNLRDTCITDMLMKRYGATFIAKYTDTSVTMIEKKYAVATSDAMTEIAG